MSDTHGQKHWVKILLRLSNFLHYWPTVSYNPWQIHIIQYLMIGFHRHTDFQTFVSPSSKNMSFRDVHRGAARCAQAPAPFTSVLKVPFSEECIIGLCSTETLFITIFLPFFFTWALALKTFSAHHWHHSSLLNSVLSTVWSDASSSTLRHSYLGMILFYGLELLWHALSATFVKINTS